MNFKTYLQKNINFIKHDLDVFASGRTTDGIKYLRLLLSDMEYDLAEYEKDEKEKEEILERLKNNQPIEDIDVTTFEDASKGIKKFLKPDGSIEEKPRA